MKRLIVSMTVVLGLMSGTPSNAGTDIHQEMIKSYNMGQGKDTKALVTMELVDSDNSSKSCELAMWRLQTGTAIKSLIRFLSPDKVKDMAFLSWQYKDKENSQWLYLPGFNQVSKVSPSMQSYSFAGDFALCDIAPPHPDEFVHRLLGEENINGYDCYKVESIHKTYLDDPDFQQRKKFLYAKAISWISKDNHLLMKVDAFDPQGNVYKKFQALEVKQMDGILTPVKMEMKDLKKKHKTILTIKEVDHGAGLKDDMFSVDNLSPQ
ncbi:MAG: outer membrane lipoprotein-sorting protein [Thermodesulfobacteriota bacterium]|nr:outer membrane lipoprotein-sorting protein [Thermodesulfobacteriota bacterium]